MKGSFRDGIRPSGPSRWEVVVSWRNPDGSLGQVSRAVAGTRKEAERVRDELRHRRHDRGLGSAGEDFASVLDEWIDLKERSLSPSTVDVYRHAIRTRLGPAHAEQYTRLLDSADTVHWHWARFARLLRGSAPKKRARREPACACRSERVRRQ